MKQILSIAKLLPCTNLFSLQPAHQLGWPFNSLWCSSQLLQCLFPLRCMFCRSAASPSDSLIFLQNSSTETFLCHFVFWDLCPLHPMACLTSLMASSCSWTHALLEMYCDIKVTATHCVMNLIWFAADGSRCCISPLERLSCKFVLKYRDCAFCHWIVPKPLVEYV